MPLYVLECLSCKKEFEATFKVTAPLPHCPHCSSVDVRRLIAPSTTFVLKGDGWAAQGYSKKSDIF
jgi:putative FmdB family regulatory protein